MKKFSTFLDESGVAATGKTFIVSTVIIVNEEFETIRELLYEIEIQSKKNKKWADSRITKRVNYIKLLLRNKVFSHVTVYYTIYKNKEDYAPLVSSHLAKSILDYANGEQYEAKIFLDKVNNRIHRMIQSEIKSHKIHFKKIRSLDDTNNEFLKLADSICGLVRDLQNPGIDECYQIVFKKLKKI